MLVAHGESSFKYFNVVSYLVSTLDGLGAYLPVKLQGPYCIFVATCMKKKIPALKICTLMLCVLRYPFGQHLDASRKGLCDGMMECERRSSDERESRDHAAHSSLPYCELTSDGNISKILRAIMYIHSNDLVNPKASF